MDLLAMLVCVKGVPVLGDMPFLIEPKLIAPLFRHLGVEALLVCYRGIDRLANALTFSSSYSNIFLLARISVGMSLS